MHPRDPVLKQALKEDWDSLAPAIRAHYGISPFTSQQLRVEGIMEEVSHSLYAKFLIPLARLAGALIPHQGRDVPVYVTNHSRPDDPAYFWQRVFHFADRKPFPFPSRMVCSGDHLITEYVRFGFGIRLKVTVKDGALIESDRGYVLSIGRLLLPLPLNLAMGWAHIEETPVSSQAFDMKMVLIHPLFGKTFSYNGRFAIVIHEDGSA